MANYHIHDVRDEMNENDEVLVRVLEIDDAGRVKLTRQEIIEEGKVKGKKPPESDRSNSHPRNDSDRKNYRGKYSRRDGSSHRDSSRSNQRGRRRDSKHRFTRDSDQQRSSGSSDSRRSHKPRD